MSPEIVGREAELSAISRLLDEAARGSGGIALLVGEPGIGKTRLAEAVAAEGETRGFRVAWGRAWESGGAPAYFPWSTVLAELALPPVDPSRATAIEGNAARFQLFREVSEHLRTASAEAPILVVLDDLHDADMSSLRMLELIARELRHTRMVVLGTHRDVEARLSPEMDGILSRVAREGLTLHLRRLGRDECARLLQTGGQVPADLEPAIWRASQGNPLFVREIVRLIEADPDAAREGNLSIPYGVREVIRQRLSLLDDASREVLDGASVLGVELDEPSLVAIQESSKGLSDAIASAVRFDILREIDGRRLRFTHALVREAIYRDLPASRREALHAAAADALERSGIGAPPLPAIAHHAIESGRVQHLAERTAKAARALADAHAIEDATMLVERALAVGGFTNADEQGAAELSLLLASLKMQAGDVAGGRALCVRIADRARARSDARLLARAALAYGSEITVGRTDSTLRTLIEEASRLLPPEERGLRVRLAARLAAALQPAIDPRVPGQMALAAVAEARALGDDRTLLEVLHFAGATVGEALGSPERLPMARDALLLAGRLGDRPKLVRAHLRLISELMERGDVTAADMQIDALESAARATRQPRYLWPVPLLRSMRALQEGRFGDSDALAEEAAEIVSQTADPAARITNTMHRLRRLRAMERGPELIALEPEILRIVGDWNDADTYRHLMRASIRADAGDLETARANLRQVSPDSIPWQLHITIPFVADIAIRTGETRLAAELYDRLLPNADRWQVNMTAGFAAETTVARLLGGLAVMQGRYDEGERHLVSALALADAIGARPERARVLVDHGHLCLARRRSGDERRARELFDEAHPIAEELRLVQLLSRIPAAAAAAEPPRAPPASCPALSLVAEGETWRLDHAGGTLRLKGGLGVAYLARLIAEPGQEIHALDLAGAGEEIADSDAGEVLDATARSAYRRRLEELQEDLREAESWNDGARASRARAEIEFLSSELARAVGLGGRPRRAGAAAERARVAVTRRLRDAVRRIAEQSPDLGRHLDATLRTGTFCVYRPG